MDDIEGFNAGWQANRAAIPLENLSAPAGDRDVAAPAGAQPFQVLGHDKGRYYFLPSGGGQIVSLSRRDLHNAAELTGLASRFWWERAFQGGKGESFAVNQAANELIRSCERVGIFDPDRIRGRGVWLDDSRVVMHLGHALRVDGAEIEPTAFAGSFIYERARSMDVPLASPLDDDAGRLLIDLCREIAWEMPERDGRLLAGFLVVAMICGGMPWRPHLWITGESGEGKSWVFDNIVKPILENLSLEVQGTTSEAGIRGSLGSDARPVIFDEAEPDEEGNARFKAVLHLARQSSSEDGGPIVKGTKEGGSRSYRIRSCFILSSINTSLRETADENRFLVLNLAPGAGTPDPARFDRLKALCARVMTPDLAARLLARSLALLPVIRANAETLASAIARRGHARRTGDTLGVALAGVCSLQSSGILTPAKAEALLDKEAWIIQAAKEAKSDKDWMLALQHLVQAEVRVVTAGRQEGRTVSELIGACIHGNYAGVAKDAADEALRRHNLMVTTYAPGKAPKGLDGQTILAIANKSPFVDERFSKTRWAAGWKGTLSRATGAGREQKRFTPAFHGRALMIPLAVLTEDPDQ